eukprot:CAMPEP_0182445892 /NCGR_PEP_ID=MMETSP1172-20130603/3848_1 /TAXON_ID=708627 /ORGANISM="Timspurckia oligopyrenoides, Strain CCMP3278" /LENGTH=253 /DNA_ID=CAMNT_0024641727 /DNA_START=393 /DNA_END=1154 /DNA_ORIENTATION=+
MGMNGSNMIGSTPMQSFGAPLNTSPFGTKQSESSPFHQNQQNSPFGNTPNSTRGGYRGGYRGSRGNYRGGGGTRGGYSSSRGGFHQNNSSNSAVSVAESIKTELEKGTPSWPLSCFGRDSEECLISGDISPEELRAEAYAAVLQGATVQMVIQHEAARVQAHTEKFSSLMQQCITTLSNPQSQTTPIPQNVPSHASPFASPTSHQSPFTSPAGTVTGAVPSPFGVTPGVSPQQPSASTSPFGAVTGGSPFGVP